MSDPFWPFSPLNPNKVKGLCFCPEMNGLDIATVSDLIVASVFGFGKNEGKSFRKLLVDRYDQMRRNFLKVGYAYERSDGSRAWDLGGCKVRLKGCHDARLEVPLADYGLDRTEIVSRMRDGLDNGRNLTIDEIVDFGHDMPVWLCKDGVDVQKCKKVMLVSQDPSRSGNPAKAVYLSTPFSLHCMDYRANNSVLRFTTLVANLLKEGFAVYATDFTKWYARREEDGKRKAISFQSMSGQAIEILKKEIACFSPDLIVAVGKRPYDCMRKMEGLELNEDKAGHSEEEKYTYTDKANKSLQSGFMKIYHPSWRNNDNLIKAGITDYPRQYLERIKAALTKRKGSKRKGSVPF